MRYARAIPKNRASATDHPAQCRWSMAPFWLVTKMAAWRLGKRGGRCGIPTDDRMAPKLRIRYQSPYPWRAADFSLLVGGRYGGGAFWIRGSRCGIHAGGHIGLKSAHSLSTSHPRRAAEGSILTGSCIGGGRFKQTGGQYDILTEDHMVPTSRIRYQPYIFLNAPPSFG